MSKKIEINFEPFELPKDYKFVYKINGCEHKVDFDTNTIVDKILSARTKKVDEEVIRQLRNIGEAKGINEFRTWCIDKPMKCEKCKQGITRVCSYRLTKAPQSWCYVQEELE